MNPQKTSQFSHSSWCENKNLPFQTTIILVKYFMNKNFKEKEMKLNFQRNAILYQFHFSAKYLFVMKYLKIGLSAVRNYL